MIPQIDLGGEGFGIDVSSTQEWLSNREQDAGGRRPSGERRRAQNVESRRALGDCDHCAPGTPATHDTIWQKGLLQGTRIRLCDRHFRQAYRRKG